MSPDEKDASSVPPESGTEDKNRCPGCGGCGRCCGKTVEYVVIDSFVWPPWPEKEEE